MATLTFEKAVNVILNKCREQNMPITPTFATFFLETVVNEGSQKHNFLETGRFYLEEEISEATLQEIVDTAFALIVQLSPNEKLMHEIQLSTLVLTQTGKP